MEALYIEAMDELLAKDLAFFQNNYAGSLTKRALGYARRFEDVFDVLSFQAGADACCRSDSWRSCSGRIRRGSSCVLIGMLAATLVDGVAAHPPPAALVDVREAASNVLAGHLADSIANAEAVRAFAREPDEARIHADNVGDYGAKTLRSWDYQNLRVDLVTSPMFVLTNTLGLDRGAWRERRHRREPRGGVHHVQLLLDRDARDVGVQPHLPESRRRPDRCGAVRGAAARPAGGDGRATRRQPFTPPTPASSCATSASATRPTQPLLFDRLSLRIAPGAKIGLVGRSGGGKTTLTRLLLRFSDVEAGEILIGGQCRSIACRRRRCGRRSATCRRTRRCSIEASPTTSESAGPDATDAEVRRAARARARRGVHRGAAGGLSTRSSASAA